MATAVSRSLVIFTEGRGETSMAPLLLLLGFYPTLPPSELFRVGFYISSPLGFSTCSLARPCPSFPVPLLALLPE